MQNQICFGMFAKYWSPGRVKTRLAKTIGEVPAARIYRSFLKSQCRRLAGMGDCVLVYSPQDRLAEFREFLVSQSRHDDWKLRPQIDGDLGARMQEFFTVSLANGYDHVLLVGSDTPNLPRSHVEKAIRLLTDGGNQVVLGPTADGGYYLVGASKKVPNIFHGVSWSTPLVWDQTMERLQACGVSYGVLPEWYDVDDVADLRHLISELQRPEHAQTSEPNDELLTDLLEILGSDFD